LLVYGVLAEYCRTIGALIERRLSAIDDEVWQKVKMLYKTYNEAYNASPYYLTEPYEGITEALMTLKEQGIKLAVLSNKPDFAVKATVGKFFPGIFDIVLGGRENIPLKPAPDALFDILNELGVTPDETAYIGDSEPDVLTAKNAGIENAFFVTYGFRTRDQLLSAGAEQIFDFPTDFLDII